MTVYDPPREMGLDEKDLRQARRLNRLLNRLPRFRTGRRWNSTAVQALAFAGQTVVPDFRRWMSKVSVVSIPGSDVSLRLTRPETDPRALLVHFHGGAWVMGNARLEDRLARAMAKDCGSIVAAVDFRNAADDDLGPTMTGCIAAIDWIVGNLSRFKVDKVLLSGESSGAHLALEALLHLRSRGAAGCVIGFYSVCGAFNLEGSDSLKNSTGSNLLIHGPSALANVERLVPSLPPRLRRGPAHADLRGLPPALFIAGKLDPIVDDSIETSARWQTDKRDVRCIVVPEAPHGFNRLPTSLAAKTNAFGRRWINGLIQNCNGSQSE